VLCNLAGEISNLSRFLPVAQHGFLQNRSVATSPVEPQGHVEGASLYSLQGAYELLSQI
jgi:hypothetical protein